MQHPFVPEPRLRRVRGEERSFYKHTSSASKLISRELPRRGRPATWYCEVCTTSSTTKHTGSDYRPHLVSTAGISCELPRRGRPATWCGTVSTNIESPCSFTDSRPCQPGGCPGVGTRWQAAADLPWTWGFGVGRLLVAGWPAPRLGQRRGCDPPLECDNRQAGLAASPLATFNTRILTKQAVCAVETLCCIVSRTWPTNEHRSTCFRTSSPWNFKNSPSNATLLTQGSLAPFYLATNDAKRGFSETRAIF